MYLNELEKIRSSRPNQLLKLLPLCSTRMLCFTSAYLCCPIPYLPEDARKEFEGFCTM
jgi:hypothetical protein